MHEILNQIQNMGIIPVVRIDDPARALPLAKALQDGGLPCAEITFRTAAAEQSIAEISKAFPGILLGAGTVLNPGQVDRAVAAGAAYIVSPGFNPLTVDYCVKKGIPVIPGCSSPSDMERAIERGLEAVKFFPAEESGGLDYIKAVSAPFPMLKFIPTGGINAENLNAYLSFTPVMACGGSWMVKAGLINEGRFDEIARLAKEAVSIMLGFRLSHVGFNTGSEEEARSSARLWEKIFNFPVKEGGSSIFAGPYFEHMKTPFLGRYGHIAVGTLSLSRAAAYLKRRGYEVKTETAKFNDRGELSAVYLKDEIAGFAVHLVQVNL
jgi:2-dehydro-3-deoxyphosphogluconate aldolase/(4S)-4-hydroxy-2-oxoglutarate aldolase